MIKYFWLFVCCISTLCSAYAQQLETPHPCATHKMSHMLVNGKSSVLSAVEDDYDVKHVFMDIFLDNLSTYLEGSVTTTAQVVNTNGLSSFAFELNPIFQIDSVCINNLSLPVNAAGYLHWVVLPNPIAHASIFKAQVFYRGQPVANGRGINNIASPSWGNQVTYTLSEPFSASYWWPCKQSLRDKIDSTDIHLTVPAHLKAGSMGVLRQVTPLPGGYSRYEWKSNYPIDYYLISLAVADYVEYNFHVKFPGTNDSVLVQNFVYNNPATLPFFKNQIDSTADMLLLYSELFGRYPFWEEKYGHCMAPINGGMEHQTMTSLGNFGTSLVAHELFHQWFGDQVTCATWKDIWINEGFASYGEYLFLEHLQSAAAAKVKMQQVHNDAMDSVNGTVYVYDTTSVSRIFNSKLTYNKGSAVVHTLRYELGDSLFYASLQQFLQQYNMGTASTLDLQISLENSSGKNLQSFFEQWVYQPGYPVFDVRWNQGSTGVTIELQQVNASTQGVNYFTTPVNVKLSGPNGDTTVRLNQDQPQQSFFIPWGDVVSSITIDPENWIMNTVNSVIYDNSLSIASLENVNVKVFPNPANDYWKVNNIPKGAALQLSTVQGKLLQVYQPENSVLIIPAQPFTPGMYWLRVIPKNEKVQTIKLLKQ